MRSQSFSNSTGRTGMTEQQHSKSFLALDNAISRVPSPLFPSAINHLPPWLYNWICDEFVDCQSTFVPFVHQLEDWRGRIGLLETLFPMHASSTSKKTTQTAIGLSLHCAQTTPRPSNVGKCHHKRDLDEQYSSRNRYGEREREKER